MNSRKLAGASAASVGAATAVAALLLGTLSGSAGEEPTASAFGIAAKGLLPIEPTPFVEAPRDGHKALLEVPGPDRNGIYVGLLKVEAEKFRSKATAVKVDVLGLRLKVIEATCENGHGDSSIIGTDSEGKSSPYSGQTLDLSPVVKVEFNRQYRDHDKLTVDAAVISLLPGDRHGQALSAKDLNLFQSLASKQLKVPTMDQLQAAHAKSAAPAGPPTVGDLLGLLGKDNPSLNLTKGDRGEALEEIVISSASCREEHHEYHHEQKEQAPPPKPVEAHLPVTH
ncbi:MAG: hypothetical protein JO063_12685 [Pseudonocardiales bacterium]|nr:hypothetical protein [Pseudonocardiales bacterium]MBV9029570.1 hypothetical protein [Pseudonocardiales bacterium]MBW0010947.1 hypothetical protein [Pseudonocardiales bacterium]